MRAWIKVALSIIIILFWSCEKESILDPVVEIDPISEKFVTINASASDGGKIDPVGETKIIVGGSKIYKFITDVDHSILSVKVNKVEQPITETYEFKNVSVDSDIKVEFIHNNKLLISKAPWYQKLLEVQEKDGSWTPYDNVYPERLNDHKVFSLNGSISVFDSNEKLCGGPYDWSLLGNILKVDTQEFKIISLTDKELVLIYETTSNIRFTYSHEKN